MGLTKSTSQVDENGRELLSYGTEDFPIAFFDDDLAEISVPAHWHDELEIVRITKGSVSVRIAGRSFRIGPGEGYMAGSGVLHSETLKSKAGHQHALVFSPKIVSPAHDLIWKEYVAPLLDSSRLSCIRLTPSVLWQKELLDLAEKAWDYGAYEREDYPIKVRSCMMQAFSLIRNYSALSGEESSITAAYLRDEVRIKKALLFVEQNYSEDITIDDIAKSAEISVSTCLRLFRAVLDTTPVKYLTDYRLKRAMDELRLADGRTIAEIALSCGFSEASYFNRCFRKAGSMTPSEYLRRRGARSVRQ